LLLALASNGFALFNTSGANNITVSDSGSHSWTTAGKANNVLSSGSGGIAGMFYTYLAAAPGSITVSANFTDVGGATFLAVLVLTGAGATQSSGVTSVSNTATTTSGEISVTTTTTGSVVFGISHDVDSSTTFAPLSGTTQIGSTFAPSGDATIATWQSTSATTTPGTATYGGTWGSGSADGGAVALEVVPPNLGGARPVRTVGQAVKRASYF
jgi:hypothetical protein